MNVSMKMWIIACGKSTRLRAEPRSQHFIGCSEHRFIRDRVDGLALDGEQDAFGFGFH